MSARTLLGTLLGASAIIVASALPAWAISIDPDSSSGTNGRVESSVLIGTDVYIGGQFTAVDGKTYTRLAAIDASTGMLDPSFSVPVNGEVRSMTAAGTTLYIAGSFTTVGSLDRTDLAAIDTTTSKVLPFSATPSAMVESIDVMGGVAYFGGKFTSVNGVSTPHIAAVDAATGSLITTFNPKASGLVWVVTDDGTNLYVGGRFLTIGGVARNYVAELDPAGNVLPWDAGLNTDSQVMAINFDPGHVYLGTGGHLPAGNSVYSIDSSTGAQLWQVQTDGNIQALDVTDETVYVGGHFANLVSCNSGGMCRTTLPRKKALAIEPNTGSVLDWNPRFNSNLGVWDFADTGDNLYAFGDFTTVNGVSHPHIARFSLP